MNEYSAFVSKIIDLKKDLLKALDFINWKDQLKKDATVFIKPNFICSFKF